MGQLECVPRTLMIAGLSLILGCGAAGTESDRQPDDPAGAASGDGTDFGDGGNSADSRAGCGVPATETPLAATCPVLRPCEAAMLMGGELGALLGANPEGQWNGPHIATCIAEGLRDGAPGLYEISNFGVDEGLTNVRIEVMADRGATVYSISGTAEPAVQYHEATQLREPSHFEACLAMETDLAMHDCLMDFAADWCADATPACPAPGEVELPECFGQSDYKPPPPNCTEVWPCAAALLTGIDPGGLGGQSMMVPEWVDAQGAECVMEHLRVGTPGLYEIGTSTGGQYDVTWRVEVTADRGAVVHAAKNLDDSSMVELYGRAELRAPAHFDGCLQLLSDPEQGYDCLMDSIGNWCLDTLLTCAE